MYIIITHATSKGFDILTDSHGFIERFNSYDEAETHCIENEIENYEIFGECTKERNHII